jgi:hypothetical protein
MTPLGKKMCNNSCCTTSVLASTYVSWEAGSKGVGGRGEETGFAGLTQYIPQFTVKVLQSLSPRDATAPAPAGGGRPRPAPPTAREGGHRFAASHYFRTESQNKSRKPDRWLTWHGFRRGRDVKIGVPPLSLF